MKKLLIGLTLLSSFSALAAPCNSTDLNSSWKKIDSIEGISQERKELHFSISKNAKMTEVLACAGVNNLEISRDELQFAEFELDKNRVQEIEKLRANERMHKSKLSDRSLSNLKRELYQDALERVPSELQNIQDGYRKTLKSLRASL